MSLKLEHFISETIAKVGLKTIKETLNLMHGWPVTLDEDVWNETNWTWQKMVTDLELVGFPTNYLFEFSINPDVKNTTIRVLGVSFKVFYKIIINFV